MQQGKVTSFLRSRLKELRQEAGWTQEQVAEAASISSIYYRFLESGLRRNVTVAIVEQISAVYGIGLHEFFSPKFPKLRLKRKPAPSPHYNRKATAARRP